MVDYLMGAQEEFSAHIRVAQFRDLQEGDVWNEIRVGALGDGVETPEVGTHHRGGRKLRAGAEVPQDLPSGGRRPRMGRDPPEFDQDPKPHGVGLRSRETMPSLEL